ncbi:ABC transporter substrate-binding protein [Nocardioides daphniae]|uniref:ABC transporter substrate-binding protein n=1 Tax=Nocardioides daphniae TaxID=402297 RepID=A0A4P7UDD0_9ACTN|nr:ABC transporter substrate-binding protein [Nocardioides daphniae]QCC77365.1 iron ABC transporter substrate-binding protein [Nocardioides daphniae]GGD24889.1 ABC transporter substrate-binding protein [Nocardioides daphniae]
MINRTLMPVASLAGAALLLAGCAGAPERKSEAAGADGSVPVELTNCDHDVVVPSAPKRVVTLNQGATEVVLALGLGDRLAGTAYLDDTVSDRWSEEYEQVPVLADEYPTHEAVLEAEPDLVYASYASAFDEGVAGDRTALADSGTASYLSPFGCPEEDQRPTPTFDAVWQELDDVAALLGDPASSRKVVADQQETLDAVEEAAVGKGLTALWYDSGDKTPLVGGGQSGPQLILDAVGARNMFADIQRGWGEASWEDVLEVDPDVIVLADASWSSAAEKRAYLEKDPVLSELTAVQEGAFVTVAYSEATPGVRMVDGAVSVAEQLAALRLEK